MAAKKSKLTTAFVLLGLLIFLLYYINTSLSISGTGFRVTSVSAPVPITSNDPVLNQKFMLVGITFSGGNDVINAHLDGDDVSLMTNGVYSSNDFSITARAIDQTAIYPILLDSSDPRIYNYQYNQIDDPLFGPAPPCPSGTNVETMVDYDIAGTDRHCITRTLNGRIGRLENPNIEDQINIQVAVGSDVKQVTLSPTNSNVALPGGRGFAHLEGYLATGQSTPSSSNHKPLFYSPRGSWVTVTSSTANTYTIAEQSFNDVAIPRIRAAIQNNLLGLLASFTTLCPGISRIGTQDEFLNRCFTAEVSPISSRYTTLISANTPISQTQTINNANQLGNNLASIRIPLDRRVGNAVVTLDLQASWIGVTRNVGEPDIRSATCTNVASGQQQFIDAVVRNAGEAASTFCLRIENCPSFQQITPCSSHGQTIEPNQEATLRVEINTNVANVIAQETCRVVAYDINNPTVTDTASASCSQTAVQLCSPGEQQLLNNCVQQCRTDGQGFEELFCCQGAVPIITPASNPIQYQCPTGPGVVTVPSTQACAPLLGFIPSFKAGCQNFGEKVAFFAALIIGIIGAAFVNTYIPNKKLGLIVSLAVGGGLFALIVNIFV